MLGKLKFKKFWSFLLILVFVFSAGCSKQDNKSSQTSTVQKFDISVYKNNDYLITPQELKKQLDNKEAIVFDCNKPDIYSKEHIPGAVSIGLHAFSDKVEKPGDPGWGTIKKKEDLKAALEALGIDNKKTVVFYSGI